MPGSGPQPRPLIASRLDVAAAIVMAVILLSASVFALVQELGHGQSARAESEANQSGGHVLRNAGTPGHPRRPSPSGRQPTARPAPIRLTPAGSAPARQQPPGPVAYNGTGPSPAGAVASDASTLSWTQRVSGGGTALVVAVAVGDNGDSGQSASATDNGTAMTALATVHDDSHPDGFLEVFGLAGVPDGTSAVRVTVTGGQATELTGGSESFDGAAQAGTFSGPATADGDGSTPAVTIASTSGGMVAAFSACGSSILSTTAPAAQEFIADDNDGTGAGNSAGAVSAANGSDVTVRWSSYQDFWGAIAVEVR